MLGVINAVGFTLGGLIAGEGSFVIDKLAREFSDGTARLRFRFQVQMASRDRPLLEALRQFLGVGSIADVGRRKETWQPTSEFTVHSLRSARNVIVPFADRYLLPSAKRVQFESWRAQLVAYIAAHPEVNRARSICSVDGCDNVARGRGLCRSHYYHATGY